MAVDQGLPKLGPLNDRLARNLKRIDQVVESLPTLIDHLVKATDLGSLQEVSRIGRLLASAPEMQINEIQEVSRELVIEAQHGNQQQTRRALLRLIGLSGRIRRQGIRANSTIEDNR